MSETISEIGAAPLISRAAWDEPVAGSRPVARPRLGFAGVGWIGRNRLEAMAQHAAIEVAAVADPVRTAAEKIAELAPGVAICDTFEQLLEHDLDGVVIATPSALHASQAISALQLGRAVFCQKPLARTAVETEAVIAAARKADRLLGVDFSYRFTAGMQQIHQLIRRGEIGRVYAVEATFHNAYGPDKAWFYDRAAAGGGCLLDLGIHLIDLALWCQDFPRVLSASGVLRAQGRPDFVPGDGVEDFATGQLELANGAVVRLACSWRAPAGCDARIEVTFFGTKGGASFRNVDGSFYDFVAEHFLPDRSKRVLASAPDNWGGRAAIHWAQQLALSPAFDPHVVHATAVAAAIDQLYGRAA